MYYSFIPHNPNELSRFSQLKKLTLTEINDFPKVTAPTTIQSACVLSHDLMDYMAHQAPLMMGFPRREHWRYSNEDSTLPLQRVWVQSLIRELRSCIPPGTSIPNSMILNSPSMYSYYSSYFSIKDTLLHYQHCEY